MNFDNVYNDKTEKAMNFFFWIYQFDKIMYHNYFLEGNLRTLESPHAHGPPLARRALKCINLYRHGNEKNNELSSKAGKNAEFPGNMVTNCVKNVIFLQIFGRKRPKYQSKR